MNASGPPQKHPSTPTMPPSASQRDTSVPAPELSPPEGATQHVVKIRRDYNLWVASETMEDYALRFTARGFRKWSEWRVANTAFGAASFLVLEAVGATLLVNYGFANAFWAILATGLIIFLAGLPISVYAARYGVDMDLLTRGAGFGYLGSTLTSLIYASFTFIFFALEAAVMAYALDLAFDIPPVWGYLVCALVVIPLVTYGVTNISRLQVITQPLWLLMLVVPYAFVFWHHPDLLSGWVKYPGADGQFTGFQWPAFGAAMTVGVALITQMGEQVDYLRFMPERTEENRRRWWLAVLVGGPGWVVPGVLKMLGGAILAYLALSNMIPLERVVEPSQMYLAAYETVFHRYGWAVAATAVFVIVSQLKINVTNAYAGSLAWSNFFSRVTHSHPGRVVWMVFNTLIALMLMELDVFQALGGVLGLFSNIAISWFMAVVADLVINKPMGWSPKGIEFRRAYLLDVNPVGVGAMGLASALSVAAHLGAFGTLAQAFSPIVALVTAMVTSPLLAWATGGRYYLARPPEPLDGTEPTATQSASLAGAAASADAYRRLRVLRCVVCERDYEAEDMAQCPAYGGAICSLCCTLEARCGDRCKPQPRLSDRIWQAWKQVLVRVLPQRLAPQVETGLGQYLLLMGLVAPALAALFGLLYHQEMKLLLARGAAQADVLGGTLRLSFVKAYASLMLVAGVVAWWLVLAHKSRQVAQEETRRQTEALMREIESHRQTDLALQQAKRQADAANQAKTRYITAISHELRTPLNSILGYAQLLEDDPQLPEHRRHAVSVIRRGGDHLLGLIEGTLDLARIEGGKLTLDLQPMRFGDTMAEMAGLFELQAQAKGIRFRAHLDSNLPEWVRADERRVRQILINLLGNAVKFTSHGAVDFTVRYAREMARIEIADSGPGMSPDDLDRVFEPFARGASAGVRAAGGTGLGLTISRMLTDLMGGEMTVRSAVGEGTTFGVKLFLPVLAVGRQERRRLVGQADVPARSGYTGPRRQVLVVDNEEADRRLVVDWLAPLGFDVTEAASGEECLARLQAGQRPDVIFVDLAMPGIDGWETLRRVSESGWKPPAVAVLSANAFDKGLENDLGLPATDFLVKPVRRNDLLEWLAQRLALQWVRALPGRPESSLPSPTVEQTLLLPDGEALRALREIVALGYPRGVLRQLDLMQAANPQTVAFFERARTMTREFQLDALNDWLEELVGPTP